MTQTPVAFPPRRLSKSSLLSLLFGILGCIPFITGIPAVVLGIMGVIRTSNPLIKGRWMAVIGLLLGVISICAWTGVSLFGGGVWALIKATEGPRLATHDFIYEIARGDDATAKLETDGLSKQDYDDIATSIRSHGRFIDTTIFSTTIVNDSATVGGIANFDNHGTHQQLDLHAKLKRTPAGWKIRQLILTTSP